MRRVDSISLFGLQSKILVAMAAAVFMCQGAAQAGFVTIDPPVGWNGYFAWVGLGQIDDISLVEKSWDFQETEWSITLEAPGYMTMVTAYDGYKPGGDEFALYVDGGHVPWTLEYYDGSGRYHGEHDHLSLSAGTHSITLYVTALAPGTYYGGAMASFSEVIPEPGTILLLGLGGLALLRQRTPRKKRG